MNRSGFTTRDVGNALGVDHSAVARWLKGGTTPYRSSVAKLAGFFEVPVEVLLDDSMELPPVAASQVLEERPLKQFVAHRADQAEQVRLFLEPIKAAAALARTEHGEEPMAGQATFERHLANIRAMRDLAERQHSRDSQAAAAQLDTLLAAYISALSTRP